MRMILIRIEVRRRISIHARAGQVVNTHTASVVIRIASTMRDCRQAVPNTHDASRVIR